MDTMEMTLNQACEEHKQTFPSMAQTPHEILAFRFGFIDGWAAALESVNKKINEKEKA